MRAPTLYRISPTLEALAELERLELSKPPMFVFQNRSEIALALEQTKPEAWALEDVWTLPEDAVMPAARIVAKGGDFALDYFLCGLDFMSQRLWGVLKPFAANARCLDVDFAGSAQAFITKNYALPIFPSLSPFEKVFIDAWREDAVWVHQGTPDLRIRSDLRLTAPIFNVATGPWLMCSEDVVEAVMPHSFSGLEFVNHETDERLVPGS